MNSYLLYSFICLILLTSQSLPLRAESTISLLFEKHYFEHYADYLYDSREIPQNLELALKYYKKAAALPGDRKNLDWKAARICWLLAERSSVISRKMEFYKEGIAFGNSALQNDGENSNSHLWYSANLGSNALITGVMKAIYNKDRIKAGFETAIKQNPSNTNAYVGLAGWYYHVPAMLGGNVQKAYQLIDQAVEIEPNYTRSRLMKAEFYMGEQRLQEAMKVLKDLTMIKNPTHPGEGAEHIEKAKAMILEIQNLL